MDEAGLPFRVTKDLGIVLVVEALDAAFAGAVWEFVELGEYETRQQSTGEHRYYRFPSPKKADFPFMLELFSRAPDTVDLMDGARLTPVPGGEDVASLSALLLDEEYYGYVLGGRRTLEGLVLLDAEHLIPMKARAWLDLIARRAAGEMVDSHDISKHRNDVIRLTQLLPGDARFETSAQIVADMDEFLARAFVDAPPPKQLGVAGTTLDDVKDALRVAYGLKQVSE